MKPSEAMKALEEGKTVVCDINGLKKYYRLIKLSEKMTRIATWWGDGEQIEIKYTLDWRIDCDFSLKEES
jgi:hypothetical protein